MRTLYLVQGEACVVVVHAQQLLHAATVAATDPTPNACAGGQLWARRMPMLMRMLHSALESPPCVALPPLCRPHFDVGAASPNATAAAASSPMLMQGVPDRSQGGPMTPVGLPELLDGDDDGMGEEEEQAAHLLGAVQYGGAAVAAAATATTGPSWDAGADRFGPSSAGTSGVVYFPLSFGGLPDGGVAMPRSLGCWLLAQAMQQWQEAAAARRAWRQLSAGVKAEAAARLLGATLGAWHGAARRAAAVRSAAQSLATSCSQRAVGRVSRRVGSGEGRGCCPAKAHKEPTVPAGL